MQRLIDPLIEYSGLTQTAKIEKLNDAVQVIVRMRRVRTLEFYTEASTRSIYEMYKSLNVLSSDAVKLSLFGRLTYFREGFRAKAANRTWYEYFIMAARNYQKVFELGRRIPDEIGKNNLYMYLFMAAAEFHNAMQHACSKSLVKDAQPLLEPRAGEELSIMEDLNYRLHCILLHFLASEFKFLKTNVPPFLDKVKNLMETSNEFSHSELMDLTCLIYIAEGLNHLTQFVLSGHKQEMAIASENLELARDAADKSGRPDLRYIVDKLGLSSLALKQLSVWNLYDFFDIGDDPRKREYLTQYIRLKIESEVYFLYPSQYQALSNEILHASSRRILISTPTGAGKTLLAELVVLSERVNHLDEKGVSMYMVPSRALAREKFNDIGSAVKGLTNPEISVCQITGEVVLDAQRAIEENDVVILTPEKLDMIIRNKFYDRTPNVLVIDEFHNIATGYRGIRIEFDLIRFKGLYPNAKIVLISALVSNFDEIRKWFNADKDFQTTWRPTFARVGLFDIKDPSGIIKFTDGVSVQVDVSRQNTRTNAYKQQAAKLAVEFASEGPCLIFSNSKDAVMQYADYLSQQSERLEGLTRDKEENAKLALRLKQIIGEEEEIYQYFVKGIGVHRGDLPHILRRIIEDAVRRGALRLLVSTTTLAEGINLPLKTIIIPKPEVGREVLQMGLFFNLFGRAGRPLKETEGQVIFLVRKKYPREALEKYEKATLRDIEKILAPVTHIIQLQELIEQTRPLEEKEMLAKQLRIFQAVLDTTLLALLVEKSVDRISDNEQLLDKIIISPLNFDERAREMRNKTTLILQDSEKRLLDFNVVRENERARLDVTEFGMAVYDTGFSPKSCVDLMKKIPRLCENLAKVTDRNIMYKYEVISQIFSLMKIPVETEAYFIDELPLGYASIMFEWMQGKFLKEIAATYFRGKVSEALITVDGLLSGYSSWFLYALSILAHYYSKNKKREPGYLRALKILPKYCYYGSNNSGALEIMQMDISHELFRDDVLRLVGGLSETELRRLFESPDELPTRQLTERIASLNLQTDTQEFIDALHRMLSKSRSLT
jgi:replicative superfamily II helicase